MKAPDLVRVTELARVANPPVSREVMLRRLRKLEKSLGRKILHKTAEGRGHVWEADRAFLSRLSNDAGKNVWQRLRELERTVADLRTEVGECHRVLAEHGFFD